MNKLYKFPLLTLLVLFSFLFIHNDLFAQTTSSCSGKIKGTIETYTDQKPIAGASVVVLYKVYEKGGPNGRTVSTDANGKYCFNEDPSTIKEFRVSAKGYAPYYSTMIPVESTSPISIS